MPAIKHCGQYRRTDIFWLTSNDEIYTHQILMSTTCSYCGNFIMEYVGVLPGWKFSPPHRIKEKNHQAWIERTNIITGDIAEGLDTSAWKTKSSGVHWVSSSQKDYPYLPIKVRV